MIRFNFRGTIMDIPREEFAKAQDQYFLANMINDIGEFTDEEKEQGIFINEDPAYARCIINSIIQKELTMDLNLDPNGVYVLADKWCCPHWFMSEIEKRDRYKNMVTQYDYLKDMAFSLYQCTNCKVGFKLSENHSKACRFHSGKICFSSNTWQCCGKSFHHSESDENRVNDGCKIGWHVPDIFTSSIMDRIKMFHKIVEKENKLMRTTEL